MTTHDIRVGSSVRGAIDMVKVAASLARLRGPPTDDWRVGLDAALVALSGRIRLAESSRRDPESVVTELYTAVFGAEPRRRHDAYRRESPAGGSLSPSPPQQRDGPPSPQPKNRATSRTVGRAELSRRPNFAEVSPEVGVVDQDALGRLAAEDLDAAVTLLADMVHATDEVLRDEARRLAARLVLDRVRHGRPAATGLGRLRSVRAEEGADLDVDASLDALTDARAAGRHPDLRDLRAHAWARPELAVCLLVDTSGSMAGERLATASLAVAACALRAREEYAVLAFARSVTVVRDLRDSPRTEDVVDATLALRGHGLTGLAGALDRAAETVGRSRASRRVVVLLSDCRATDGVDPVPAATGLTELLVVAPASDADDAIELAAAANARLALVSRPSDVVEALNEQLRAG